VTERPSLAIDKTFTTPLLLLQNLAAGLGVYTRSKSCREIGIISLILCSRGESRDGSPYATQPEGMACQQERPHAQLSFSYFLYSSVPVEGLGRHLLHNRRLRSDLQS